MGSRTRTIDARSGFTLIEALAASVVLALASIAIVGAVLAAHAQSDCGTADGQGAQLARQLMEEISAKPFADPTDGNTVFDAVPKASRALFVNVDDYQGYADSTPSLATVGLGIASVSASGTYQRSVSIEYRSAPSGPAVAGGGDFALVTVKVTSPQGALYTLSQLMARAPLTRYSP